MADSLENRNVVRHPPTISKELVEYLEWLVPAKCPSIMDAKRSIWVYSGKRELVEFLRNRYDSQVNRQYSTDQ